MNASDKVSTLIKRLECYDKYSFEYTTTWLKTNIHKKSEIEIYELFSKKTNFIYPNSYGETENITIYYLVNKCDGTIKTYNYKIVSPFSSYSNLRTKFNDFKKKLINSIQENSTDKIRFYIFPSKSKIKKKDFEKRFKTLQGAVQEYKYQNVINYIDNFSKILIKFLPYAIAFFIYYLTLYYETSLNILGIPYEATSIENISSTIKTFVAVFVNILFRYDILIPLFILLISIILPFIEFLSTKKTKFIFTKILIIFLLYVIGFLFILKDQNFLKLQKNDINASNPLLNHYISKSMYPRVIDKNNTQFLAIFKDKKYFYTYDINKTFSQFNIKPFNQSLNVEKNCTELPYQKLIISILKYSQYTDTKNINLTLVQDTKILDKNQSFAYLLSKINSVK